MIPSLSFGISSNSCDVCRPPGLRHPDWGGRSGSPSRLSSRTTIAPTSRWRSSARSRASSSWRSSNSPSFDRCDRARSTSRLNDLAEDKVQGLGAGGGTELGPDLVSDIDARHVVVRSDCRRTACRCSAALLVAATAHVLMSDSALGSAVSRRIRVDAAPLVQWCAPAVVRISKLTHEDEYGCTFLFSEGARGVLGVCVKGPLLGFDHPGFARGALLAERGAPSRV